MIRVLNLWQKNQVFAPEVIQPLFDLADPNHPIYKEIANSSSNGLASQSMLSNISKGVYCIILLLALQSRKHSLPDYHLMFVFVCIHDLL